jgi:hypothetical protein
VVKGKQKAPLKVALFGPEGIGKSTFGADAPAPLFIAAEDGTNHLDVARVAPSSFAEVLDVLNALATEEHSYQTVVLDTLDWVEPMVHRHVCDAHKKPDIESFGYGKGFQLATDEWRLLLNYLERVRARAGMNVVLLAHSHVKTFKNPAGDDYERYEMKLHRLAGALMKEWVDILLFANYEEFAQRDEKKRVRGTDTGARIIHTSHRATWDAKNRHNLPEILPLGYAALMDAIAVGEARPAAEVRAEIVLLSGALTQEKQKKVEEALGRAGDDALKLAQLLNWTRTQQV